MEEHSRLKASLLEWFSDFAPVGILVTDSDLRVVSVNSWLSKHQRRNEGSLLGRDLLEAVPDLTKRGFDRYYKAALAGETRLLSHRFHKHLIPLRSELDLSFNLMQQSATISPLHNGDAVIGTVTMIEDVTERVVRESEFRAKIQQREESLAFERLARETAEENAQLRTHNELLNKQGAELLSLTQIREAYVHRVITSQEDERKRIARDLHDHLGQQLTALRLSLSLLRDDLCKGNDPCHGLDTIETLAKSIDSDLDFISGELRPRGLDDLGLEQSLSQFVDNWSKHFGIACEFHSLGFNDVHLPPDVMINVYRIAQEGLHNISKHAQASVVSVLLEYRDRSVVLIIEDNGIGFDVSNSSRPGKSVGGSGLVGMKERAVLINGSLEIESTKGRGTTVFARVDLTNTIHTPVGH